MIAVISNYPTDKRPLSEYGYYLSGGMRLYTDVMVVSGKTNAPSNGEMRVWDFGSPLIPLQTMIALEKLQPRMVLLNTSFTCWGSNPANLAALMIPWLLHRRYPVLTIVHDLPQLIDVTKTGYTLTSFHKGAIELASRSLATSSQLCFTLPRNASFFRSRYPNSRVNHVPHGILGDPIWKPLPEEDIVLTFGKFGRAKNPEPLIKFFSDGSIKGKFIVAGPSSATKPGFVESLAQRYSSDKVIFTGYVPEEEVTDLFHGASLIVLPYEENVGASGVLMQCCQYGRPVVLKRLPIFEQTVEELGLCVHFYSSDEELKSLVPSLLSQKALLEEEGRRNYVAVQHLRMEYIAQRYMEIMELI